MEKSQIIVMRKADAKIYSDYSSLLLIARSLTILNSTDGKINDTILLTFKISK